MITTSRAQGVDCQYCEDGTPHEHTRPVAAAFAELREAWIEMPFDGVVPEGWGDCVQRLVHAVSAIVDPERTLREDPEVKRRGDLAGLKQRYAFANDQRRAAIEAGLADLETLWATKCTDLQREARERHGVEL